MIASSEGVPEEPVTRPAPQVGEVVAGRYRLGRIIGEGGMGVVFEAEHIRLRQRVAVKFLRPEVIDLPEAVARFEREAHASARMRGPHVVTVVDVDTDEAGRPFLVMELLDGRDLEAELRERGALPIEQAVDWVMQACAAATVAHAAGIVHRDLKPSNLFLVEEAGRRFVKVLDFGISKIACDAEPTVTSTAITVGTPLYMSPEQVRSSRDVDERTDVWALGVILYELLAGSPPFLGTTTAAIAAIVADATPSLRQARPEVPQALERVVMTALAKDARKRFPSAEAFAAALLPFASGDDAVAPRSWRPSPRASRIARHAMATLPVSRRASDASDLLRLPPSKTTRRVVGERRGASALRTFFVTMGIGVVLASAASILGSAVPATKRALPAGAAAPHGSHAVSTAPPPTPRTAPPPPVGSERAILETETTVDVARPQPSAAQVRPSSHAVVPPVLPPRGVDASDKRHGRLARPLYL